MKFGTVLPLWPLDTDIIPWHPGSVYAEVDGAYQNDLFPDLDFIDGNYPLFGTTK